MRIAPVNNPVVLPPTGQVAFSYNPQDTTVMPTETLTLNGIGPEAGTPATGQDAYTDKVKLNDNLVPVDNAYVYAEGPDQLKAHTFASVARTVELFRSEWPGEIKWATQLNRLHLYSDQGEMLNAYYSRDDGGLYFWHAHDPVTEKTVYTAASGEVSAHEAAHAILDAVRPGYFGTWTPEPMAFHESFGDVMALLVSLQDDRTLDAVIRQTGGDLTIPNVASQLGEELGITINHTVGHNETGGDYTRTAHNSFVYADPNTIPWNAPSDQLGGEPHSFARLWTGAVYELLTQMVTDSSQNSCSEPREVLRTAGREVLKMYSRMLQKAPEGDFTMPQMAQALVQSENELNEGQYTDLITRVFTKRGLLQPAPPVQNDRVEVTLDGPQFGNFQGARVEQQGGSGQRTRDAIQNLIKHGEIKYVEPNGRVSHQDLFKPDGSPYKGVARWNDGQLTIERVLITDCQ